MLRKKALLISALLLPSFNLAQAAKLPGLVRIDGQPWAIKLVDRVDDANTLDGSTECGERTIYLLKSLSAYDKADTIVHEVQHAFTCDRGDVHNERFNNDGKDKASDGHAGIYWATPHWHRFIRDNPDLIRYILDADPPDDCEAMPSLPSCSPHPSILLSAPR